MTSTTLGFNAEPKSKLSQIVRCEFGKIDLTSKFVVEVNPVIQRMKYSESCQRLPKGYQPSEYDVICGRGKGHYNQPGNRKFRDILLQRLPEYQRLKTRIDKTVFLNEIIDAVRSSNNGQADFVRCVQCGVWERLSDDQAREKVGHAIREALAPRYKIKGNQLKNDGLSKTNISTDVPVEVTSECKNLDRQSSFQKKQIEECLSFDLAEDDLYEPLPVTSGTMSFTAFPKGFFNDLEFALFARSTSIQSASSFVAV